MAASQEKGLSWEDGLLEFEAQTGLKLDAEEGNYNIDPNIAQKILD